MRFIFVVLCLVTSSAFAGPYDKVSKDLVRLAGQNQILIYGESHQLRDARYILMQVLAEGVSAGIIDGFATEYVSEEFEEDFQAYLTQPDAGVGTEAEKAFFAKISKEFVWTKDEVNLQFYRYLRALKLVHPNLKICGLDVTVSKDPVVRAERFRRFSPLLLQTAQKVFGHTTEEMIATGYNYDREPLMAQRAVECLRNAKHGLVHMGAFHSYSARFKSDTGWEPTSYFMRVLRPSISIPSILTAMRISGQSDHWLFNMTDKAHFLVHAKNPAQINLVRATTLNTEARKALVFEGRSFAEGWDYFIFGPEGEYSPLFD